MEQCEAESWRITTDQINSAHLLCNMLRQSFWSVRFFSISSIFFGVVFVYLYVFWFHFFVCISTTDILFHRNAFTGVSFYLLSFVLAFWLFSRYVNGNNPRNQNRWSIYFSHLLFVWLVRNNNNNNSKKSKPKLALQDIQIHWKHFCVLVRSVFVGFWYLDVRNSWHPHQFRIKCSLPTWTHKGK